MSLGEMIIQRLKAEFPDARMKLNDTTGTNDHWELVIATEALKDMTKVKQHQAIYKPLRDLIDSNQVHALKLSIVPLEDWKA